MSNQEGQQRISEIKEAMARLDQYDADFANEHDASVWKSLNEELQTLLQEDKQ